MSTTVYVSHVFCVCWSGPVSHTRPDRAVAPRSPVSFRPESRAKKTQTPKKINIRPLTAKLSLINTYVYTSNNSWYWRETILRNL